MGATPKDESYLQWLSQSTRTRWWNDSANTRDLMRALDNGATGVTTNPLLTMAAIGVTENAWIEEAREMSRQPLEPAARAEALTRLVVTRTAALFAEEHRRTGGADGYVCAQVNPGLASDRLAMHDMARRFSAWAPNIAVKLPANMAGLDVLEDCIAEGITVTSTVSFTVAQVLAIAERHQAGVVRAEASGTRPGQCFAVIMIGRVDDYLKDIARDNNCPVKESDLDCAGLAVTKRACAIYREKKYRARLCVAALRGPHHMSGLAGADLVMSIHPSQQDLLLTREIAREEQIDRPVPASTIERLATLPDFVRAYEPGGMNPCDFAGFGLFQRTITQFSESGWKLLERYSCA
ncbi:MAG: transaldolase family protein [Spirochaetia bacterium]